jgi:hypothetical protein
LSRISTYAFIILISGLSMKMRFDFKNSFALPAKNG